MPRHRILVVEDDPAIRFSVGDFLQTQGYDIDEADSVRTAENIFRMSRPDAALIDYQLSDGTALDLLPRLKLIDATVPAVVLTGNATIDLAVKAIKEGAQNFLTKPVELPALALLFERLIEANRSRKKEIAGKREQRQLDPFLGTSERIAQLREVAGTVAASDSSVLIVGETGSGKGVLARWIHDHSSRADEAYVNLNCAGLSRDFLESELFGHEKGAFTGAVTTKQGLLEVAHRGTVFLDEIGDVDPQVQPKLLKVLEEKTFHRLGDVRDRRVDIRLIAATHQDLSSAIRGGRFRSDLYFRISTIPLQVPPLRERPQDIPLLAQELLRQFAGERGGRPKQLTREAEQALMQYAWPGNIRELRNVLERAVLLTKGDELDRRQIFFDAVGAPAGESYDLDLPLAEVEERHIKRVLDAESGNVERAAKRLGIPRSTLYQRIKQMRSGA
jgi:DNA-binding NtrC family response regulator